MASLSNREITELIRTKLKTEYSSDLGWLIVYVLNPQKIINEINSIVQVDDQSTLELLINNLIKSVIITTTDIENFTNDLMFKMWELIKNNAKKTKSIKKR